MPADAARVRRLLVALGDLRVLEAKTEDPARYPALAVEDVEAPKAQSLRLELGGPPEPLALLIGHAAAGQGAYVRVPGQRQALEVRPSLDVPREPRDWLARTIVDLAPARVQSLEVEPGEGPAWRAVKAARDAAHFDVPGLPKGRELASLGAADGAGSALATLDFEEVRKAEPPAGHARPEHATVRTFDGLVVSLEGRRDGEARWLTLAASYRRRAGRALPARRRPVRAGRRGGQQRGRAHRRDDRRLGVPRVRLPLRRDLRQARRTAEALRCHCQAPESSAASRRRPTTVCC